MHLVSGKIKAPYKKGHDTTMKRNMFKTAEAAKISPAYGMTTTETVELMEMARTGDPEQIFKAIYTAFNYGYVLGARAENARAKKDGYVTLKEYAAMHNLDVSTIKKKITAGLFPEAEFLGTGYVIPANAPWIDRRLKQNRRKK